MELILVETRSPALLAQLLVIWEASVRATHDFLSEAEVQHIKGYVPQALRVVPKLLVAEEQGVPLGFIGAENERIEMLFVAPEVRGKGVGSALVNAAKMQWQVTQVTVNEQNPQAIGFYEHMGFHVIARSPLDDQGMPYPILTMAL